MPAFLRIIWNRKGGGPLTSPTSRCWPSSTADGAQQIGRLTNLTQLTIEHQLLVGLPQHYNPDFDPNAPFAQAVPV